MKNNSESSQSCSYIEHLPLVSGIPRLQIGTTNQLLCRVYLALCLRPPACLSSQSWCVVWAVSRSLCRTTTPNWNERHHKGLNWPILCTHWKAKPVVCRDGLIISVFGTWHFSIHQFLHVGVLHGAVVILASSFLLPGQIAFSQQNSIMDLVQFFVTFFRWVNQPSILLHRDLLGCPEEHFTILSPTTPPPLHVQGVLLEPFTFPF